MCLFAKKYSDIKLPLPLPKSYQESRDIKRYYGQKCIYVLMKHIYSAPSNFNTEVTLGNPDPHQKLQDRPECQEQ